MATTNKTILTGKSVKDYIAVIPKTELKIDAEELVKLMQEVTGEAPKMWGPSIIGFGTHHYVYESGREGDTPAVSFAARKSGIVLYGIASHPDNVALIEKVGSQEDRKGCIYMLPLAEVDKNSLEIMIKNAYSAA